MTLRPYALVLPAFGFLAACQTGSPSQSISFNLKAPPQRVVASIARSAQECWFKSGDAAFRGLRISSEVNSYAGRPRILLVKRSDPNGLPRLVVQAEARGDTATGKFTNIQTFGPLLQTRAGQRIASDVRRWSNGSSACR